MDLEVMLAARPKERVSHGRLPLGTTLGDWRVEAYLGAGRSAEVYRVTHARMGGQGALKLLVDASYGLGARFQLEMDVLRTLAIPSLPRFFAAGDWEGRPYYVMEYLQPLILPLERKAIVPFMLSLAESVAALHAAGYLHRDLKPDNILRRADGTPVLIDLGLVKRFVCSGGCPRGADSTGKGPVVFAPREHTRLGATKTDVSVVDGHPVGVGTRGYAAPEQLNDGKATVRSDVYALGKVMRACGGKTLGSRARAVIRKATAEDPEERYADAAAFAAAVRRCRWPHPAWMVVGAVASLALCVGVFLGLGRAATPWPPRGTGTNDVGGHGVTALPTTDKPTNVVTAAEEACQRAEAYFHGRGVATNYVEAVRWYAFAASNGLAGAQASLGVCRLRGLGCTRDAPRAAYWFYRAAKQGNLGAMVDLAFCYHSGIGVPRDDAAAFTWAMEAAKRGHVRGQCFVGECYLDGYGVAPDARRADVWLQRAARQGDTRAQNLLMTR